MASAQCDHTSHELEHVALRFKQPPIKPENLVVLAPGVVVPELGSPDFVTVSWILMDRVEWSLPRCDLAILAG